MCGIAALFRTGEQPVRSEMLERALAAMRHRGPDGTGTWISLDHTVGLAHARLSIIDPEGGAQPLASEDEQVRVVVNGEFYDFERIRQDLEARGHRFRTGSDSEILVHLYEEYGVHCVHHLRGEFALVLWDARNRLLFAARDRFGIKPLCYAEHRGALFLASEAKALFAAGFPAGWDEGAFFQAASLQYLPPDRTLFSDISQLPPGHALTAMDGRVRVYPYWDLDYPVEGTSGRVEEWREGGRDDFSSSSLPSLHPSIPEAVEQFRARLEAAVRLRLRADVPVACHLSGGLDSSGVTALAARQLRNRLDCFTVSFEEAPYDELRVAEETAQHAGANLHVVRVTQADLVEALPDAVTYSEGLAINGHLPAKFLLSRAMRGAGYRVVLTGEGSDEALAGYAHLRRDLLLGESGPEGALHQLEAGNQVSAGLMLPKGETLPLDAVHRSLGFVPSFLEAKGTLGFRLHGLLSAEFRQRFAGRDPFQVLLSGFDVRGQLAGRSRVDQSLYLWNRTALSNYILKTLGDGTEMAHSVEGRLPFLDHHLFEFARSLPLSMKIRNGVEKFILREALRPLLTETVYRRQKHPFLAPPVTRSGGAGRTALLQDLLHSQRFSSLPFFDLEKIRTWLNRLPQLDAGERAAADPVLMTVLSAALIHERFRL